MTMAPFSSNPNCFILITGFHAHSLEENYISLINELLTTFKSGFLFVNCFARKLQMFNSLACFEKEEMHKHCLK